ncbi:MAG TPA: RluA family pseudouridine synthase [Pirellulales bacterium]|nr:RluA family pseudouridine synthase [Pirellulales bacterium]
MRQHKLDILYEDNHLLAVNKPAGLPTMGVAAETDSLVRAAKAWLKQRYDKPGNVYLGVVSRLDAVVSGVVLLARTSKAAARLTEQFRSRAVEKTYWAVVAGMPQPAGRWIDWIAKDESAQRMAVVAANDPRAQQAVLEYRVLRPIDRVALVEIRLITGRKHQIRLQCSAHRHPVLGDRKYGSSLPFEPGIALHARRLVVDHPTRHEPVEIEAPLPASWKRWQLG